MAPGHTTLHTPVETNAAGASASSPSNMACGFGAGLASASSRACAPAMCSSAAPPASSAPNARCAVAGGCPAVGGGTAAGAGSGAALRAPSARIRWGRCAVCKPCTSCVWPAQCRNCAGLRGAQARDPQGPRTRVAWCLHLGCAEGQTQAACTAERMLGQGWRSGSGLWMHVQAFTGQLWVVWQAAGAGACWSRPDGDTRARRGRPGNLAATCAHCSPSGRMHTLNASIGARRTGSPECLQRRALGARRHPRPRSPGSPRGPHPNMPPDGSVSPRIDYAEQIWMGNLQSPTQVSHGDRSGGGKVGGQEKGRVTRSAGVAWLFCAH
jgi:hypothetical protein